MKANIRAPYLLPDSTGVYHLVLGVGATYYPFATDYVEECLPSNELVVSLKGLRKINDVTIGENVLTHAGRFKPITHIFKRFYRGDLLEIKTYYYPRPLRVTPDHPVLRAKVLRGRQRRKLKDKNGEEITSMLFTPAKFLKGGDYIPYPISQQEIDVQKVEMEYLKIYPDTYSNSIINNARKREILSHRLDSNLRLSKEQHQTLQLIFNEKITNYQELNKINEEIRVYDHSSGLARGLTRLLHKNLLEKPKRGFYNVTQKGKEIANNPHNSYENLAHHFNVSSSTIYRVFNPPLKEHLISRSVPLGEELCSLIGYYLAEGSPVDTTQQNKEDYYNNVEFSFGNTEKEQIYAESVVNSAELLGFSAGYFKKQGCYHAQVYSRHLTNFLRNNFGHGAHNKFLPLWYRLLPKKKLNYTLQTYLNGDGHLTEHNHIGSTVSINLAFGLKEIGNKLGYRTSITSHMNGINPIYTVVFYSNVGTRTFRDNNYIYLPIQNIQTVPYVGDVYNLEIKDDNSYCTPYHTVHNCRVMGVSKRLPKGFDFSKLTAGESALVLVHPKAIPDFSYDLHREPYENCPRIRSGKHKTDAEDLTEETIITMVVNGKTETFAQHQCLGDLWDLSSVQSVGDKHELTPIDDEWYRVDTPSTWYDVKKAYTMKGGAQMQEIMNYEKGIFMRFPNFHFEFTHKPVEHAGEEQQFQNKLMKIKEVYLDHGYRFKVVEE